MHARARRARLVRGEAEVAAVAVVEVDSEHRCNPRVCVCVVRGREERMRGSCTGGREASRRIAVTIDRVSGASRCLCLCVLARFRNPPQRRQRQPDRRTRALLGKPKVCLGHADDELPPSPHLRAVVSLPYASN